MSGQPCKGFLCFFAMKRAPRRPVTRDASDGCGCFPRGDRTHFSRISTAIGHPAAACSQGLIRTSSSLDVRSPTAKPWRYAPRFRSRHAGAGAGMRSEANGPDHPPSGVGDTGAAAVLRYFLSFSRKCLRQRPPTYLPRHSVVTEAAELNDACCGVAGRRSRKRACG